ncbi:MAG: Gx transporter family protein [Christensenellales bacterium]|jgi:heptaprenyl diphosphate synthase
MSAPIQDINFRHKHTRRLVLLGVLTSLALVLHGVESWIALPFAPAPGIKLGLANMVTVAAMDLVGPLSALVVTTLRAALGPLLGGSVTGVAYAMAGALTSFAAMAALRAAGRGRFSRMGLSVAGAVCHHVGQLAVAAWVVGTASVFTYLPVMTLAAIPTGLAVGYGAGLIEKAAGRVYRRGV